MINYRFISIIVALLFLFLILPNIAYTQETTSTIKITNEMIYQKLLELEKNQIKFEEKFNSIDRQFQQIDKRFDQIDKRFEDVNKRFDNLIHLFGIIVGAFVAIVVAVIGFALWDRRTIINAAKIETIKEIEKEGKLIDLIASLRKLAQEDSRIREVLKTYHLL